MTRHLEGQTFGRLVAAYRVENRTSRRGVLWHCTCACGRSTRVTASRLVSGEVKSCGCLRVDTMRRVRKDRWHYGPDEMVGRRFGAWTVLARAGSSYHRGRSVNALWVCRCDCGAEREVRGGCLRSGKSLSCGHTRGETLRRTRAERFWSSRPEYKHVVEPAHIDVRPAITASRVPVRPAFSLMGGRVARPPLPGRGVPVDIRSGYTGSASSLV